MEFLTRKNCNPSGPGVSYTFESMDASELVVVELLAREEQGGGGSSPPLLRWPDEASLKS